MNLRRYIKNNVAGILKAFHLAEFLLDLQVQLSSGATGLKFGRILQLHPFFCAGNKGSGETKHMCSHA